MREANKIGHPIFIICVLTLILNDWYFKTTFHNNLTGKLSDFAGLFAFSYLLGTLFPKGFIKIHIWTALLFIFWKSELSQSFINLINEFGIPINRTIDFTDNIALISLFISYFALQSNFALTMNLFLQKSLVLISCVSFMATTMPPRINRKYVKIYKQYEFPFSKRELISRLNMVQMKEVRKINKLRGLVDFDSKTNVFHFQGKTDTLALLLDPENINDLDVIQFKTSFAEILILGNEKKSELVLLTVYKTVSMFDDKDYRDKAITQFEKRIINKIKNYR